MEIYGFKVFSPISWGRVRWRVGREDGATVVCRNDGRTVTGD